jgi:hypothetical protein
MREIELVSVEPSKRKNKKLVATFKVEDVVKKIHFGQNGSFTYAEGASDDVRNAYIARHTAREDWTNPLTPGALSFHILWNAKSVDKGIKNFKKIFNL